MQTVTPKCYLCGAERPESELNGIEVLKTGAARYEHAHCIRLAECKSPEAIQQMAEIAVALYGE